MPGRGRTEARRETRICDDATVSQCTLCCEDHFLVTTLHRNPLASILLGDQPVAVWIRERLPEQSLRRLHPIAPAPDPDSCSSPHSLLQRKSRLRGNHPFNRIRRVMYPSTQADVPASEEARMHSVARDVQRYGAPQLGVCRHPLRRRWSYATALDSTRITDWGAFC
jgi:hypothetical protein